MDAYERALLSVGERGRFQLRYWLLYNVALVVCCTMVYMNIVMVLTVPPHSCDLGDPPGNTSRLDWKRKNLPLELDSRGRQVFSSCLMYVNGTNITTECSAYEYDTSWYGSTAASAHGWVCGRELLVADVFAYSRIGESVGSVALGWLGDRRGRKAAYMTALALMITGRIITAFSSGSFPIFFAGCVIAAFSTMAATQSTMLISMETTSPENRGRVVMIQNLGWAVGMTLMPLFYWALGDWYSFLLVTTGTLVPFSVMSWWHLESPRWLWTKQRQKDCVRRLQIIARANGRQLSPRAEKELLMPPPSDVNALGPLALFSSCTLALNTLLVLTLWFCVAASYAVLTMGSGESDEAGNPFLRFAWQGLAEVPGYLAGAWLADRVGRRLTVCSTLAVAGSLSALSAVTATGWMQNWLLGMVLLTGKKLCLTAAYYISVLLASEIYPTCLRQTGLAFGTVMIGASFAVTPYINYLGRRVDARLPGAITAGMCVLGLLAGCLLPETLHAKLSETLKEAQEFGLDRRRNFFKLPRRRVDGERGGREEVESEPMVEYGQEKS